MELGSVQPEWAEPNTWLIQENIISQYGTDYGVCPAGFVTVVLFVWKPKRHNALTHLESNNNILGVLVRR